MSEPALTDAGADIVIPMSCWLATNGVTAFEGRDSVLLPTALMACTVKEYVVPLLRPVKFTPLAVAGTLTFNAVGVPPIKAVTEYPVIADPPLLTGAVQAN